MSFELRSPPVVEAWIRASTLPSPESEWSWENAKDVLQTYGEDFPVREILPNFVPKPMPGLDPEIPRHIKIEVEPLCLRVKTSCESKVVQLGQNEIVVAHTRTDGQGPPGFQRLLAEFLDAMQRYDRIIPIVGLAQLELHYVDLVVIPGLYEPNSSPSDYFVGAPILPAEPFGDVARVSWSHVLYPAGDIGHAYMSAQLEPPDGNQGRFLLHWHFWCPGVAPLSSDAVDSSLRQAHDYLLACFRATCKNKLWELFGPLQG